MKKKIMGLSLICVLTVIPFSLVQAQTTGVSNAWTNWLDRDNPSGEGDAEVLPSFLVETPAYVCTTPSAVEARVKGTTQVFTPGMITPQKLRTFEAGKGLQCYNADQPYGTSCADYEVRFLCAAPTLGQTKAVLQNIELFKLETPVAQGNAIALATFTRDAAMDALRGRFSSDLDGKITAFNDLAEGADERSGDGIFTAFTTLSSADEADINASKTAFQQKLSTVQNPQVREFVGRAVISTQTFNASSSANARLAVAPVTSIKGFRVLPAPSVLAGRTPPALVVPGNALVINDKRVVANASFTFDPCNTDATGNNVNANNPWSFKTLISNLNNETTSGMTDQQFAHEWLRNWIANSPVGAFSINARPNIKTFFQGWDGVNASTLNMDKLPFRLLAVVNRIDLASIPAYGVSAASKPGEIRFVFGLVTRNSSGICVNNGVPGAADRMTAIFEYGDATNGCSSLKSLANQWLALDSLAGPTGANLGNTAYMNALKAITDTVTAPNANRLNQLRTNDFAFDGIGSFGLQWQLREFAINPTTKKLAAVTIKQTPQPAKYRNPAPGSSEEILLHDYLGSQSNAVLCESHSVPETFNSQPFLGSHADYNNTTTWPTSLFGVTLPTSFPTCYKSSIKTEPAGLTFGDKMASEVRHKFAVNTCDDCHAAETDTFFVHIDPINRALSGFMTGIVVNDTNIPGLTREFNDLARRNQALVGTSVNACNDPRTLNTFQAIQSRLRFIH